jgi:hypothetical protein
VSADTIIPVSLTLNEAYSWADGNEQNCGQRTLAALRVLIEHVAKLEALLDRVPHEYTLDYRGDPIQCVKSCRRCEWEKMNGGKRE